MSDTATEPKKPDTEKKDEANKQGFIRPPAQGGKKEYTIPNGTRVKHN